MIITGGLAFCLSPEACLYCSINIILIEKIIGFRLGCGTALSSTDTCRDRIIGYGFFLREIVWFPTRYLSRFGILIVGSFLSRFLNNTVV